MGLVKPVTAAVIHMCNGSGCLENIVLPQPSTTSSPYTYVVQSHHSFHTLVLSETWQWNGWFHFPRFFGFPKVRSKYGYCKLVIKVFMPYCQYIIKNLVQSLIWRIFMHMSTFINITKKSLIHYRGEIMISCVN